jgi:hypothetical protein
MPSVARVGADGEHAGCEGTAPPTPAGELQPFDDPDVWDALSILGDVGGRHPPV